MSTTKRKTDLIRLAWITELRRQGHRQCVLANSDSRGNLCALMLLWEMAGRPPSSIVYAATEKAGLSDKQAAHVMNMNDGTRGVRRHTFVEIADVVAGWFPAK